MHSARVCVHAVQYTKFSAPSGRRVGAERHLIKCPGIRCNAPAAGIALSRVFLWSVVRLRRYYSCFVCVSNVKCMFARCCSFFWGGGSAESLFACISSSLHVIYSIRPCDKVGLSKRGNNKCPENDTKRNGA